MSLKDFYTCPPLHVSHLYSWYVLYGTGCVGRCVSVLRNVRLWLLCLHALK